MVESICSCPFLFSWIICVVLDMQLCVRVLCMHNIWGCGWNSGKWSVFAALPPLSLPQICSYFQTPKIFSLSLDRAKCSPLGSIILSHPAKAVALGGSVKNFISNHRYICLLSVVLGFSSLLWKLQYFIPNFTWFYAVLLGCLISKCHFSGFFFSGKFTIETDRKLAWKRNRE